MVAHSHVHQVSNDKFVFVRRSPSTSLHDARHGTRPLRMATPALLLLLLLQLLWPVIIQSHEGNPSSSQDPRARYQPPSPGGHGKRRRLLASIPLQTDSMPLPNLDLVAGQDLRSQIEAFESAHMGGRMDATSRQALQDHSRALAREQGLVFRSKVVVVVVTIMDVMEALPPDSPPGEVLAHPAARLVEDVIRTALSSTSYGDMILVTLGLSLCEQVMEALTELVVTRSGWDSFTAVPIPEFEGYPSAINQARRFIPPDSIVAVFTPSFLHSCAFLPPSTPQRHESNTTTMDHVDAKQELFVRYEGLVQASREKGGGHLLVTALPPCVEMGSGGLLDVGECVSAGQGLGLPLLLFDEQTFEALGPLDEGYILQGGIAEWIHHAQLRGWHEDMDPRRSLHPPRAPTTTCPMPSQPTIFEDPGRFFGNSLSTWVRDFDVVSNILGREEWLRLLQQDMDGFYLRRAREASSWQRDKIEEEDLPPLSYHERWSGRAVTPSLLEEDWRKTLRVAAVLCIYDDTTFLPDLLPDLLDYLDHVVVLVSEVPWHGPVRDNAHTMRVLADFMSDPTRTHNRLSVTMGRWASEKDQRQFGNEMVKRLPGNFTHVMVVDGDEFWHPVELQLALNMMAKHGVDVTFGAAKMWTYWKTLRSIIYPPEELNILWLVSPWHCNFIFNREVDCLDGVLVYGVARCHHLSYVRTSEELMDRKLASFSHANEVYTSWYDNKWRAWDDDNSIMDLHPTKPSAYKQSRPQPFTSLPPSLRRLHLRHRHGVESQGPPSTHNTPAHEFERMMSYLPPRCDIGHNLPCLHSFSLSDSCRPT